ncbi:MAG TPA: gamma-glutamyltransferase [Candidatus Limnocylindrales bacterium]|nr:gamma-glutamyltransferase [Candidatus Limnocylindrales bacterium]
MSSPNGPRTGRPPTRAPLAMVSTSHYLATASGLRMLQNGGSAVDALIAANAVLCVAYPHMAGLGGDGFWLIHDPRDKKVRALDASGPAAAMATRSWYSGRAEDGEIPSRGGLAALTVPGAVDGWREAHEAYGRLSWRELFDDAIRYASQGVPVSRSLADWLTKDVPVLKQDDDAAGIFLHQGHARREGERLIQDGLARSLDVIARDGARAGFYDGGLAEELCGALESKGSPLRTEDLAAYRAEWVEPIETTYRDHRVLEFPPATQGFAALQVLNLIEDWDLVSWGDGSADYFHHMAEAVKVAFADRDAWLTDPRFVDIPLDKLISKDYARERRDLIKADTALEMTEVEPGIEWDSERRREEAGAGAGRGARRRSPDGDTVYFCAVDADGLVVSAIQSVYHDFGAGIVAGETGIIPQNRGSFFSLDDDHPNRLEPGKRTFHTIIPAMLLDGDEPRMAFGSMGGEGQPQTHAALLTRVLDFGYDVQQAIEAPRWLMGRTWGVESRDLSLEGRVADEVLRELERRGQPVKVLANWDDNMGHAAAIRLDPESGFLEGGADPRGDGAAAGY